jgi:hypothetical protein
MPDRYFTPAEVEALIPRLVTIIDRLRPAHAEATELRQAAQADQQRVALLGGAVIDRPAWAARQKRIEALVRDVQAGIEALLELGGVPKDLDLGLVDFPHQREGKVVNLCWKYGEHEIRYWHGLDEGYAARKPL